MADAVKIQIFQGHFSGGRVVPAGEQKMRDAQIAQHRGIAGSGPVVGRLHNEIIAVKLVRQAGQRIGGAVAGHQNIVQTGLFVPAVVENQAHGIGSFAVGRPGRGGGEQRLNVRRSRGTADFFGKIVENGEQFL